MSFRLKGEILTFENNTLCQIASQNLFRGIEVVGVTALGMLTKGENSTYIHTSDAILGADALRFDTLTAGISPKASTRQTARSGNEP